MDALFEFAKIIVALAISIVTIPLVCNLCFQRLNIFLDIYMTASLEIG